MMDYKLINLTELVKYSRNARVHSPNQIGQIARSIKEFGFTNPILIDEKNNILAGHGRYEAAQELGIEKVPCIVVEGLSEEKKKAYILADNKIALNSDWDNDLLHDELMKLFEADFDISLTGFSELDLNIEMDEDNSPSLGGSGLDYEQKLEVAIECNTEAEQKKIYDEMEKRGFKCRILSM